jgi:hypothetical protein
VLDYNEEVGYLAMRSVINLAIELSLLFSQGLLHAGLIKATGVGYMLVPERIQLGVLD